MRKITTVTEALKEARQKADDYYWIRDAVNGVYWDKEVKRLEALHEAGQEFEVNF